MARLFTKMKIGALLLLMLTGMHTITAFSQGNKVTDTRMLNLLKKFRTDYARSLMEKKPEVMQVYFSENIKLMPEFERTIHGKRNAMTYYRVFSSYFEIKDYKRTENDILDMDSLVFELGVFSMNLTVKNSGEHLDVKGKYINVWKKSQKEGLLLLTDAWNYNPGSEANEKLRFVDWQKRQIHYDYLVAFKKPGNKEIK